MYLDNGMTRRGTTKCIKYYKCVSVFLPQLFGMKTAYFLCSIILFICGLSDSTVFFHITSQTPWSSKKKMFNIKCVSFSTVLFFWNISHYKKYAARYDQKCTVIVIYRGADKSLARSDWKKQLKCRQFSSDAEVIAAAATWSDGQRSGFLFLVACKI